MSKFKSYREESRIDYGMYVENGENPSREQLRLGALFRIADGIEETNGLLQRSGWCSFRRAVEKMADEGITIRHEHSLSFKFHWSIRWPWQQRAGRKHRTWHLFKRRNKA